MPSTGAVIVAAGRGNRMRGIDKVLAPLAGRPLLSYAVAVFQASPAVDRIVIAAAPERVEEVQAALRPYGYDKLVAVCAGGERRQDSVLAGLERLGRVDLVAIHDAARPLVTPDLIEAGFRTVGETGAAIAAVPVVDTLKEAGADGTVVRTVPRERLWAVQTPQVFDYALLLAAHRRYSGDVTDDAMLAELCGHRVKIFPGSPANIKVTTAGDLILAQALLRASRPPARRA